MPETPPRLARDAEALRDAIPAIVAAVDATWERGAHAGIVTPTERVAAACS